MPPPVLLMHGMDVVLYPDWTEVVRHGVVFIFFNPCLSQFTDVQVTDCNILCLMSLILFPTDLQLTTAH